MVKTQILVALGAVAIFAGAAHAQIKGEGRFTFDSLPQSWTGDAPVPADTWPMKLQSDFDPKLPTLPVLSAAQTASVKLRVVPTYKGEMLQVEASNQSMKDILQRVTDTWGIRAVIDPTLAQQHLDSAVFRAPTPQHLLDIICEFSIKQFKWIDGSLYFVDKVNPDFTVALSENRANAQLQELIAEQETKFRDADPFTIRPGTLKPPTPQPNWEKREFNGHEFYYIPGVPQPNVTK